MVIKGLELTVSSLDESMVAFLALTAGHAYWVAFGRHDLFL